MHWPDSHGWCALHVAVLKNNREMVEYLLSTRTNPNFKNREGWTPLHVAVRTLNLPLVTKLIQGRADVNVKGPGGWTALHLAAHAGNCEIIEAIQNAPQRINTNKANVGCCENPAQLRAVL